MVLGVPIDEWISNHLQGNFQVKYFSCRLILFEGYHSSCSWVQWNLLFQVKEEESGTLEAVQAMQAVTVNVQKSKDAYTQRSLELERLKKDNASAKEIEKAEQKLKKAQEEYKNFVDKYSTVKEDFESKMSVTCKNFQELEVNHLKHMKEFLNSYAAVVDWTYEEMGKVHKEFRQQCFELTVDQLLEQFVRSKSTGLERPGKCTYQILIYFKFLFLHTQVINKVEIGF